MARRTFVVLESIIGGRLYHMSSGTGMGYTKPHDTVCLQFSPARCPGRRGALVAFSHDHNAKLRVRMIGRAWNPSLPPTKAVCQFGLGGSPPVDHRLSPGCVF